MRRISPSRLSFASTRCPRTPAAALSRISSPRISKCWKPALRGRSRTFASSAPVGSDPAEAAAPIESRADEHAAAALDGARLFALFLDEYHITAGPSADRARQALVPLRERSARPSRSRPGRQAARLAAEPAAHARPQEPLAGDREPSRVARGSTKRGTRSSRSSSPARRSGLRPCACRSRRPRSMRSPRISAGLGAARKSILFVSEGFARHPGVAATRRCRRSMPPSGRPTGQTSRSTRSIRARDRPNHRPGERRFATLAEQTDGGRAILDVADRRHELDAGRSVRPRRTT